MCTCVALERYDPQGYPKALLGGSAKQSGHDRANALSAGKVTDHSNTRPTIPLLYLARCLPWVMFASASFCGCSDDQCALLQHLTCMQARNRHFLSHLYIKCIILPRQARDKHRENSKKVPFSLAGPSRWHAAACSGTFVIMEREASPD
jgi:hypothetical protein